MIRIDAGVKKTPLSNNITTEGLRITWMRYREE